MPHQVRVIAELVPPAVEGGPQFVTVQIYGQGAVGHEQQQYGRLLEGFVSQVLGGGATPVYIVTVLTLQQALFLRRVTLELRDVLAVEWAGWQPDERAVPPLSVKMQAIIGALKMAARKAVL